MTEPMVVEAAGRDPGPGDGAGPGNIDEEARWVRQAQGGDLEAFERLYRRHVRRVYGLCLRMTADAARAEELTQDAFVRAWQKLDRFEPTGRFAAWLVTLAANVVLTDRRARRRRARWLLPMDDDERTAAETADTEVAMRYDASLDLEKAMDRLPPRAREVFVLHDVEGRRHEEIATLAGIAVGTSKAQLHRARRILREALRS